MEKQKSLGEYLKTARVNKDLTLRKVESLTSISNPYLSQLEGDKIKQPSPNMLHKLSELYEVPYETVMKLAGYPMHGGNRSNDSSAASRVAQFASRIGHVTKQEEDALFEYLEFLRSRGKKGGRR
jgi:transcriptional regulator with XRE-family HTH domain